MKSIIRGMAMVAAVFAFGVVAANAQINYGAEVKIPFEFNVGEHAYKAGKYTVKINKQMVAGAALTIQEVGSDTTQTILLTNGGGARSGAPPRPFHVVVECAERSSRTPGRESGCRT